MSPFTCRRKRGLCNLLSLCQYTITIELAKTGCLVTLDHFDLGWAEGRSRRCSLTQWNRSLTSHKSGELDQERWCFGQSSLVCARFEHQSACAWSLGLGFCGPTMCTRLQEWPAR